MPEPSSPEPNASPAVSPPASGEPATGEPVVPAAWPSFGGLYATLAVAMAGSDAFAVIASSLDCTATAELLGAGDWSVVGTAGLLPTNPDAPELTGLRWLLLQRGEEMALLSLGGSDNCVGSVQRLSRGPLRASGALSVETTATMIPAACVEGADGRVSIIGLYDADGGWVGRLDLTLVPALGSHALDESDLGSQLPALSRPGRSLFELLAAGTDLGAAGELAPGEDFVGEVVVDGTDPFSGRVTLSGLVNESGGTVDLDASFGCHVSVWRGTQPEPVSQRQGITLRLTSTLEVSGDFGVTSTAEVELVGVLEAMTSRRYEATITATGSGTFEEIDYSDPEFTRRCTGEWTGSQQIDVGGEVGAESIRLTFTPAGPPETAYSQPCNVDAHTEEPTLPFAYSLSGTLDVAWPPGSPETDHQTIELPIPGLGSDVWEVTFTAAP